MLDTHPALTSAQKLATAGDAATAATSGRLEALREDALARLDALREMLAELDVHPGGIGHNQPPEPIEGLELSAEDVRGVIGDVDGLRTEIAKTQPDREALDTGGKRLAKFGLKVAAWAGQRFTKFADAALVTLAPVLVAKATNVLPMITDAVSALMKFVTHLPM
jgi:hypothetical protein